MRVRVLVDRFGDAAIATALLVVVELDVWAHAPTVDVAGGAGVLAGLLAVMTLPLAWRRRVPAVVLLLAVAALIAASGVVRDSRGLPVEIFIALLLAFYSVGANCEERRALAAGAAALAAIATVDLADPGFFTGSASPRPAAWLAFAIAWLVGRDMRRRRRHVTGLESRAARLEREREENARLAVSEERARIARELHDIVAHGVSVIVAQARAGPHLVHDPERAAGAFRAIETSGRDALIDLRRLLGILRSDDQELAIGPQPGLDSLASLVDQVSASGLPVQLRVEGEPMHLPAGVDLSAYRIVQEALTNIVKHAGPATAEVAIRFGPRALELEIVDDGRGASGALDGTGHGLIGMRERVTLYGGTIEARTRDEGGYVVRARLPVGDAS